MDKESCLHEEHGSQRRDGNNHLPKIEYEEINWADRNEVMATAELYSLFCEQVNQEDVTELRQFNFPDGDGILMIEAEARLYGYKYVGAQIQLAYVDGVLRGFLIYSKVFDRIIAVRCLYFETWTQGFKLGKGIINSLLPIPKLLIFQSKKTNAPERMLEITKKHRVLISGDENFFTYHMEWKE